MKLSRMATIRDQRANSNVGHSNQAARYCCMPRNQPFCDVSDGDYDNRPHDWSGPSIGHHLILLLKSTLARCYIGAIWRNIEGIEY